MSAARILVLNFGSSSLKASLIELPDHTISRAEEHWGSASSDLSDIVPLVQNLLLRLEMSVNDTGLDGVGYRVVHGGHRFPGPARISADVIADIEAVEELAPLHNVLALQTIAAGRALLPEVPHVACMDTSFHSTLPEAAYRYPLPELWYTEWGVRRFGFHGLSVAWSVQRASDLLDRPIDDLRLVVAHLGSGCSVTAVDGGRSVDTTMGLTPLEGLMMGTRSGSVDPGVLLHLLESGKLSPVELRRALEHESGLKGVSGLGSNMRQVQEAAGLGDKRAELALAMFIRRSALAVGAAATSLNSLDGVVFTGGIGEHAHAVRQRIVDRLAVLGVSSICNDVEKDSDNILSEPGAGVPVLRVEAREDLVIACETAGLLGL